MSNTCNPGITPRQNCIAQQDSTYALNHHFVCGALQAADKAQRQHLDNLRPEATEERQKEVGKGALQALHALAPIYSLVILQHSTYKQVRLFSLASVLCPLLPPLFYLYLPCFSFTCTLLPLPPLF